MINSANLRTTDEARELAEKILRESMGSQQYLEVKISLAAGDDLEARTEEKPGSAIGLEANGYEGAAFEVVEKSPHIDPSFGSCWKVKAQHIEAGSDRERAIVAAVTFAERGEVRTGPYVRFDAAVNGF